MKRFLTAFCLCLCFSLFGVEYAFVANYDDDTLSMVNLDLQTTVDSVSVGNGPIGVALAPNNERVYISNFLDDSVTVLNATTLEVIATISVGNEPDAIVISSDSRYIYVANSGGSSISVIDSTSDTVSETILLSSDPQGMHLTPAGDYLYVTRPSGQKVSVVRTSDNAVVANFDAGNAPYDVTISSDGTRAYVVNNQSFDVSVINTSNYEELLRIELFDNPESIVYADFPSMACLFVGNTTSERLSVIRMTDGRMIGAPRLDGEPKRLILNLENTLLYVTLNDQNAIQIIDTVSYEVQGSISVGNQPIGITIGDISE